MGNQLPAINATQVGVLIVAQAVGGWQMTAFCFFVMWFWAATMQFIRHQIRQLREGGIHE